MSVDELTEQNRRTSPWSSALLRHDQGELARLRKPDGVMQIYKGFRPLPSQTAP